MGNADSKDAADLAVRLDRIKKLTADLSAAQADATTQRAVVERIRRELAAARKALTQIRNR
jgi:hypothetical protein